MSWSTTLGELKQPFFDIARLFANGISVVGVPEGRTKDGFETQFGTNYLAHFHLFQLLKPTLLASSTRIPIPRSVR